MDNSTKRQLRRGRLAAPSEVFDERMEALLGTPATRRKTRQVLAWSVCIIAAIVVARTLYPMPGHDGSPAMQPPPSVYIVVPPDSPPRSLWSTRSSHRNDWQSWVVETHVASTKEYVK